MNETKNCPQCDSSMSSDSAFCPYCGYRFEQTEIENIITPNTNETSKAPLNSTNNYEILINSFSEADINNSDAWINLFTQLLNISREENHINLPKVMQIIFDSLRFCSQKEFFLKFTNETNAIIFMQKLADSLSSQSQTMTVAAILPHNFTSLSELLQTNASHFSSTMESTSSINIYLYTYIQSLMTTFLTEEGTQNILSITSTIPETLLNHPILSRIKTFQSVIRKKEPEIIKKQSSPFRIVALICFIIIQALNALMLIGALTSLFTAFNPTLLYVIFMSIVTAGITTLELLYGKTAFPQKTLLRIAGFFFTSVPYGFLPLLPYTLLVIVNNKEFNGNTTPTKNTALREINTKYQTGTVSRRELFIEIINL